MSLESQNRLKNSGLDHTKFMRPPLMPYAMDNVHSFAILALDMKITPNEEPKVIEIGGNYSGMNGFAKAKVPFNNEPILSANPCEEALIKKLYSFGTAPLAYVGAELQCKKIPTFRMDVAKQVFNPDEVPFELASMAPRKALAHVDNSWKEQYKEIADTLIGIEQILEDKKATDSLFTGIRDYKAKTYDFATDLKTIQEEYGSTYFIMKPNKGSCGHKVRVVQSKEEYTKEFPDTSDTIIEPFIPSKPIQSTTTGDMHDGCLRYIVLVEENKKGDIKLNNFSGYWRLCYEPLPYTNHDSRVANFSNEAHAQRLSEQDLSLVETTLERIVPIIYKNLLTTIRSTK